MYIFLDESGDLGFDFEHKNPSAYFIITLLVCKNQQTVRSFRVSVKKTLRQKLNYRKTRRKVQELKGSDISLAIKQYFYHQLLKLPDQDWQVYSIIVDKKVLMNKLGHKPEHHRIYNVLSGEILSHVDFSYSKTNIHLVVDLSKAPKERRIFNQYLIDNLEAEIPVNLQLSINHEVSHYNPGLQAADLFCSGIASKYQLRQFEWYDEFADHIQAEVIWNPKIS